MNMRVLSTFLLLSLCATAWGQRWQLDTAGRGIVWTVDGEVPHYDHIEMSGSRAACVLRWGVDGEGAFSCERSLVFPLLRTVPNNTHASLMHRVRTDIPSLLSVDGLSLRQEAVERVAIDGALRVESTFKAGKANIGSGRGTELKPAVRVTRTVFPSATHQAVCEIYEVENMRDRAVTLYVPDFEQRFTTLPERGVQGSYVIRASLSGSGTYILRPGERLKFGACFQAFCEGGEPFEPDVEREYAARMAFIAEAVDGALVLETPDPVIDRMFRFAKLRTAESIIDTRGGYMHAPGGESYYAAIWANDQAEYVNPFFAYLGYGTGLESARNSFRHFARFMNPEYRPIPSSIIAEGDDIWNGAGDRGDAAMIAYGAGRYALACGDEVLAREVWPLVEWCLEYCRRRIDAHGVVSSDSDELEGRFPSGDANLCTSSLYYDALLSASYLCRELGMPASVASRYRRQAAELRKAIERHFGAEVQGYGTYRYYEGCELLRSWICIPLTVGILDRAEGTIEALFGPELWSDDGLLTQQGSTTYWDRSTLYALRGAYCAGRPDLATRYLKSYSVRRLLGDHVPYAIEAWPEGSQRHLSAESGLYCRILTEGLFGIRPVGLHSFEIAPQMPAGWDRMALRRVKAWGREFDVEAERRGGSLLVRIVQPAGVREYTLRPGATVRVDL